ncbi:MAG: nucleotidyltransferase family protein [Pseudolabrys sp.]
MDVEALRRAIAATSDWPAVVEGARRNRIAPAVLSSLRADAASQIPADVLSALRHDAVLAVSRSLGQIPALESLCATLTEAKIRFLIVKGLPLSFQLYGDPARRCADDIDVLVAPDQFWQADGALTQSGYRCTTELRPAARYASYTYWIKDLTYTNKAFSTSVELHHRLTANPYLLEWPFDEIWNERVHVRIGQADVPTLPSGRLPLYLFAHGANHGWERLRWLLDLTAVLEGPTRVDAIVAEAEPLGLGPAMLQTLVLAHELLGFPLAPQVLDRAGKSLRVKWLDVCLNQFRGRSLWRRRPPMKSWDWLWQFSVWFFIYNLSLKADWRYRAHQSAAMWIHPPDWNIIRLPPALFWLYPLIRPFIWMNRRWQK